MPKFKFEKLVRDKIVEHQVKSGARPKYRILSGEAHKQQLIEKLIEEAREILAAPPEEQAGEIADVQQVLDDLKDLLKVKNETVSEAQALKNQKNGAFKQGSYIESVEVDEHDEWVAYYRKNADRYPEVM